MTEDKGVGLKGWLSGPRRKVLRTEAERLAALDKHRIAVLPLSNISPDPQDEYFADGMTEEVISTVSKIEGLEVISRTSVMQYKQTPRPVREVSRELDVGTVLEGSVRKAGNRLRVNVQMIHVAKRHASVGEQLRQRNPRRFCHSERYCPERGRSTKGSASRN